MMLKGRYYSSPRFKIGVVHVDDVVQAHVAAMEKKVANGKRYILSNKTIWFKDIARITSERYTPRGYSIPSSEMWYITFYMASFFSRILWSFNEIWNRDLEFDNTRSIQELGIEYRTVEETLYETAEWMLDTGMVKRSAKDLQQAG